MVLFIIFALRNYIETGPRKEKMPDSDGSRPSQESVTSGLLQRMQRDLVFVMRFLGESQHLMQVHFQDFILRELAALEITEETHPLIHAFVERHAILLRDFVFSGVSLSRQLRIEEVERLTGDTMIRVDIWDQLRTHIEMAEQQFRGQAPQLPAMLEAWKSPEGDAR